MNTIPCPHCKAVVPLVLVQNGICPNCMADIRLSNFTSPASGPASQSRQESADAPPIEPPPIESQFSATGEPPAFSPPSPSPVLNRDSNSAALPPSIGPRSSSILSRRHPQRHTLRPTTIAVLLGVGVVVILLIAVAINPGGGTSFMPARDRFQVAILDELASTERDFDIAKWYPPEPVIGAEVFVHDYWFPIEQLLLIEMNLGGKPHTIRPSEDDLRKCRAIRVEYTSDEGFGRMSHRDEVFVVTGKDMQLDEWCYLVLLVADTSDFHIGK